ncbi:MAG: MBL fold metallo-hydrolase, partial [Micavibrio sp.]
IEDWIEKLKPRITYLTVLTNFMDYDALCKELPDHIRPAYDGLVIEI